MNSWSCIQEEMRRIQDMGERVYMVTHDKIKSKIECIKGKEKNLSIIIITRNMVDSSTKRRATWGMIVLSVKHGLKRKVISFFSMLWI